MKKILVLLFSALLMMLSANLMAQSEFVINGKEVTPEEYDEYESTSGEWHDTYTFCVMNIPCFPRGVYYKRTDGSMEYIMENPISLDGSDCSVVVSFELNPYHREEVLKSVKQGRSFVMETWEDVLRYIDETLDASFPNPPVLLQNDKLGSYFHRKDK